MWDNTESPQKKTGFSDDSQVGDVTWIVFWLFILGLVAASLAGCSSLQPKVQARVVQGVKIVDHIDTDDAPKACGDRSEWAGCHMVVGDVRHIWRSSFVQQWVIDHEDAHALGMMHTEWKADFTGRKCALIFASYGKYKQGDTLCIDQSGESIIGSRLA